MVWDPSPIQRWNIWKVVIIMFIAIVKEVPEKEKKPKVVINAIVYVKGQECRTVIMLLDKVVNYDTL